MMYVVLLCTCSCPESDQVYLFVACTLTFDGIVCGVWKGRIPSLLGGPVPSFCLTLFVRRIVSASLKALTLPTAEFLFCLNIYRYPSVSLFPLPPSPLHDCKMSTAPPPPTSSPFHPLHTTFSPPSPFPSYALYSKQRSCLLATIVPGRRRPAPGEWSGCVNSAWCSAHAETALAEAVIAVGSNRRWVLQQVLLQKIRLFLPLLPPPRRCRTACQSGERRRKKD